MALRAEYFILNMFLCYMPKDLLITTNFVKKEFRNSKLKQIFLHYFQTNKFKPLKNPEIL